MIKSVKRLGAAVLSAVMMLTAVATPLGDNMPAVRESMSLTAGAASVDENYVWSKIKELKELFPTGSYFTKNGKNSCHTNVIYKSNYSYCYSSSCPDCKLENVLNYNEKAKNTVVPNVCKHKARYSCCGFATFVFCYIFEHDTEENITKFSSSSYGGINDSFLSKLKPGDYITCDNGTHYAVFLGYDNNNIYLYESNYDSPNQVEYYHARKRNGLKWSKFDVRRSKSYSDNGGSVINVTDHYKLTSPDGYQTIRKEASTSSANLGSINTGNVVCVTKYSSDNEWGYLTYNGVSGWIRLYYVEKTGSTHSYGSWYTKTSATCTSGGTEERKCSCGATESRSTSALGHNYGSTYYEAAHPHKYAHLCQRCGYKEFTGGNLDYYEKCDTCYNENLPGKPYLNISSNGFTESDTVWFTWEPTDKTTHYNLTVAVLSDGEYKTVCRQTYVNNGFQATFGKGQYRAVLDSYNSNMFHQYTDDWRDWIHNSSDYVYFDIDCAHEYESTIVKPTYSEKGYTIYTCTKCGYSYKDNETAKLTLAKVTNFKVKSLTSTNVTLQWNKNSAASGYEIEQYKSGKWVNVAKITGNATTSYTVKGLAAGTAGYKFRMRAVNDGAYSDYTSVLTVNTNPYGVGGFKCSSKTSTSVTLKWNKGTTASGYQLQQYKDGKWVTIYTGTKATNTSYTVKKLKAGMAGYRFRIRAYKTYGNTKQYGSWSSEVKVNTNPYGVGGFKAKSTAKNSITLGWNKGTTASGYQLQQYKGGKWVTVYTGTKATSTSCTIKSLKANTSYKFRIRAYKTYGNTKQYGSWSKELTVRTKR